MEIENNRQIKRNLLKYTVLMSVSCFILVLCMICVIYTGKKAEERVQVATVNAVLDEYEIMFSEKINSDFDLLFTLSEMIEQGYIPKNYILSDKFKYSEFEKIGYYSTIYENNKITLPQSNIDYQFDNRPENEKDIIRKAWQGECNISKIYEEDGYKKISYAVPVYKNDKVEGALTGVIKEEKLAQIVDSKTASGVIVTIAWVDQDGNIIDLSRSGTFKGKRHKIIQTAWDNKADFEKVSKNIKRLEITLDKQTYPVYCADVGFNGWSLIYIDSEGEILSPIDKTIFVLMVIFITFMTFGLIMIFLISRYIKNDKKTISRLSDYDQLTGVYNAGQFIKQAEYVKQNDKKYGVAILNFRHFQYVNSIFGRNTADKILIETAKILKQDLAESESICRYKSDEFCMLLQMKDNEDTQKRILHVIKKISAISEKLDKKYVLRMYCGISVHSGEQTEFDISEMMNEAEFALKTVKNGYGNDIAFYDASVRERKIFQNQIENSMEQALKDGEFKLYLQPKKNLLTDEITGAEALVRWIKPDGSMIFPDQFIPLFEANGFCISLDLYMVEQVCALQKKWLDEGRKPVQISINQSKLLFYHKDYIKKLCSITHKYGIDNKYVVLEILEGLVAENIETLNQTINILRENGFQISMDDFGSGYSSLNTFTSIELDEIKLDRVFLRSMGTDKEKKQKKMMENIISIARGFGIRTVTEGVETKEQEIFLKAIGCDYGQGYSYSKPIPAEEFEKLYMN